MEKSQKNKILIVGGAGFIGINAADYFLSRGWNVSIFDNLSRRGTDKNLQWLTEKYGAAAFTFTKGDIVSDLASLQQVVEDATFVLHLAGQVAVTTSVQDPRSDFMINALGTFNVLEAVRASRSRPSLVFSSTNKVYGGMEEIGVRQTSDGYRYTDLAQGVPETFPLDFHSPYGCSKGTADQYVRDYARIYGLDTVVLRQSCIYGPRQFGIEDQGWVAWFAIAASSGRPITIYGDGWQSRDVLHVTDLCALYEAVFANMNTVRGRVYNAGGGSENILSLRQTLTVIEHELGSLPPISYADWRPGDQRIYVSDIKKASIELGWRPAVSASEGVASLVRWVRDNKDIFQTS
jgi:CDP-paratose 2-epimerase